MKNIIKQSKKENIEYDNKTKAFNELDKMDFDIKKDIEVFMTLVGKEGDRYYMFAAQNSSESFSISSWSGC